MSEWDLPKLLIEKTALATERFIKGEIDRETREKYYDEVYEAIKKIEEKGAYQIPAMYMALGNGDYNGVVKDAEEIRWEIENGGAKYIILTHDKLTGEDYDNLCKILDKSQGGEKHD